MQRAFRFCETSAGNGAVAAGTDDFAALAAVAGRYPSWPFRVGKRNTPSMSFVFAAGTGATFTTSTGGFYQSGNHSADTPFGWTAIDDL